MPKGQFTAADLAPQQPQQIGQYSAADLASPPAAQAQPDDGLLSRAWRWLNTGAVSGDQLLRGRQQEFRDYQTQAPDLQDATDVEAHPLLYQAKKFATGALADTADVVSSFTSPLSAALGAMSAAGNAGRALATTGPMGPGLISRAMNAVRYGAPKVAEALQRGAPVASGIETGAGIGFGAQGAGEAYDAATDDNQPLDERLQRGLQGAGQALIGARGALDAVPSPRGMFAKRMNATSPNEQFTPQERMDAARDHGINLDLADATEAGVPTQAKRVVEYSLGGRTPFETNQQANSAKLNDWGNQYLDKLSPHSGEAAGSRVQVALERDLTEKLQQEQQIYHGLDERGTAAQPDLTLRQKTAQQIIDDNKSYYQKHPEEMNGATARIWKKIEAAAQGPPQPKAAPPPSQSGLVDSSGKPLPSSSQTSAQPMLADNWYDLAKQRSDHMAEYRSPDVVGTRAEGWLKQLVGAEDQILTSPELSRMSQADAADFRAANDIHSAVKSTYDNPQHQFYSALRTPNASQSMGMLSGTKAPELARQINSVLGPNAGDYQRSVVEKILGRNPTNPDGALDFKGMATRLKQYSPEYLQSLLGSDKTADLYKMARVGATVTKDENTSGTAKRNIPAAEGAALGSAAATGVWTGHPAAVVGAAAVPVVERGIARTLVSPRAVDYLTQPKLTPSHPSAMTPGSISAAMAAEENRRRR